MAVSELPGNPTSVWTVKKLITGDVFKPSVNCLIILSWIFAR